jgi:hypothetical protein
MIFLRLEDYKVAFVEFSITPLLLPKKPSVQDRRLLEIAHSFAEAEGRPTHSTREDIVPFFATESEGSAMVETQGLWLVALTDLPVSALAAEGRPT